MALSIKFAVRCLFWWAPFWYRACLARGWECLQPSGWLIHEYRGNIMSNKKQLLISVVVLVAVVAVAVVAYRALSAGQMSSSTSAGSASTSSSSIDQSQALSQSPDNSSSANGSGSATSGGSSGNSQALPSFSVLDSSGAKVSSDSVIGKPTFIGFWATWCPNCVSEAPDIQKLYDTYGDRVNFMMIDCVDGQRETVDIAKQCTSIQPIKHRWRYVFSICRRFIWLMHRGT